jgi:hypothetical protein
MFNYNPNAAEDDGSCIPFAYGCTDDDACNYDADANTDDATCNYECVDCAGIANGTTVEDECGVCGGSGPAIGYDCDGNCISSEMLLQVSIWGGDASTWSILNSSGDVVQSGNTSDGYSCDVYCGDLLCGFNEQECYTFETDGTFDGSVYFYLPNPDDCNGCTTQIGYLDGWLGSTSYEFCMPEECDDDEIQDNVYTYGWGGYEEATWTVTNLITGEEVSSGDIISGSNPGNFMCFEDGVYELTVCDEESGYDDFSADICVGNGNECAYVSGWNMSYDEDGFGCTSDMFTVNMDIGCTDPMAMNYNPYAGYDDGSCLSCEDESFIILQWQVWGNYDGDETWAITDDETGEVVASGMIEQNYDCDTYCGDLVCVPNGCFTMTTEGDFDGYIWMGEPSNSNNCNGCTDWLGEAYGSNSSTPIQNDIEELLP